MRGAISEEDITNFLVDSEAMKEEHKEYTDTFKPRVSSFSVNDMKKADQLLKIEKMKLKISQNVAKKHDAIEMFCKDLGTRSISDFDYKKTSQGSLIKVKFKEPVHEPHSSDEEERNLFKNISVKEDYGGQDRE